MDRPAIRRAPTANVERFGRPVAGTRGGVRSRVVARRLVVVMLLVAPLMAGELGIRALIALDRLPVAPAHQASLEVAWTNYDRTGSTDILILGDSLARQGIHPGTLAGVASDAVGRPVTAYNLSTPGAGFPVYRALIEQLGREGRLPKIAVIGISTVALQRSDRQSGRALRSAFGRFISDCGEVSGLEDTLLCRFESISALWRWRGQPGRLVDALREPVPTSRVDAGITLEADGFASSLPMRPKKLDQMLEVALENTAPIAQSEPDLMAYADLVTALRSRGVRVISVLIPYSPPLEEALAARESGWRALRQSLLERLAIRGGQPILDPGPPPGWTTRDSHDARHFSLPGARRFTRHLWQVADFRSRIVEGLEAATSLQTVPDRAASNP